MSKTILIIGAFDVKGEEYAFIKAQIEEQGFKTLTMNFGTMGSTDLFPVDIENAAVAKAGGADINKLIEGDDRGKAMAAMAKGAAQLSQKLFGEKKIGGVFGMGGTGGSVSSLTLCGHYP
jgi:uncharacterized protein (UPF0261 family)